MSVADSGALCGCVCISLNVFLGMFVCVYADMYVCVWMGVCFERVSVCSFMCMFEFVTKCVLDGVG